MFLSVICTQSAACSGHTNAIDSNTFTSTCKCAKWASTRTHHQMYLYTKQNSANESNNELFGILYRAHAINFVFILFYLYLCTSMFFILVFLIPSIFCAAVHSFSWFLLLACSNSPYKIPYIEMLMRHFRSVGFFSSFLVTTLQCAAIQMFEHGQMHLRLCILYIFSYVQERGEKWIKNSCAKFSEKKKQRRREKKRSSSPPPTTITVKNWIILHREIKMARQTETKIWI